MWAEFYAKRFYKTLARLTHNIPQQEYEALIHTFSANLQNVSARYVKVFAKNVKLCPDWHPSAGGKAWLFVDEIIIE